MRVAAVIPAHDEAEVLETVVKRVSAWGRAAYGPEFAVVISENGSRDATAWLARLLEKLPLGAVAVSSPEAGKGGAVKRGAAAVEADVYLMLDADLSADLGSAATLVAAVAGGAGIAIGSRRMEGSSAERAAVRKIATAAYAALARTALGLRFRDLQCGCKAFSREVRDALLPQVRDDGFFFDTEFLARSERAGVRVEELPIRWSDRSAPGRGSKVRLVRNGLDFLRKLLVLRREFRCDKKKAPHR